MADLPAVMAAGENGCQLEEKKTKTSEILDLSWCKQGYHFTSLLFATQWHLVQHLGHEEDNLKVQYSRDFLFWVILERENKHTESH